MGMGSAPFVNWVCLVSHGEIRDVMSGDETFRRLEEMNIYSYESGLSVLVACLVSIAAFSAAAICLEPRGVQPIRPDRRPAGAGRARARHRAKGMVRGYRAQAEDCRRSRRSSLFLGISQISSLRSTILLRRALAETDRLYPAWRLDELEAARERVPDAKNAALRVSAAAHLLPSAWQRNGNARSQVERDQLDVIAGLPPAQRLAAKTASRCRRHSRQRLPSLEETRGLADLPGGRFPVTWTKDGISTLLPHLAKSATSPTCCSPTRSFESEAGNADASLTACRAILNVGRSIGDEPALVSQRWRMDLREKACRQVERHAGAGSAVGDRARCAPEQTSTTRKISRCSSFGLRGERALMDRFLSAVDSGEFTRRQLRSAGFAYTDVLFWNTAPTRAIQLRFDNRAERIACLPARSSKRHFSDSMTRAGTFRSRLGCSSLRFSGSPQPA